MLRTKLSPSPSRAQSSKRARRKGWSFLRSEQKDFGNWLSTALVWRGDLLLTLVLVFDQFEEIFTLRDATFRGELAVELGALVTGIAPERLRRGQAGAPERFAARPDVKIVISLREDYLGALEEFSAAIPSLFDERLRLGPLTEDEAQAAITGPAQLIPGPREEPYWMPPFNFDPSALNDMIAYLEGKSGVIEPFQLQLVCRHAEAIAHSKGRRRQASDQSHARRLRRGHGLRIGARQFLPRHFGETAELSAR